MRISLIKAKNDIDAFKTFKGLGFDVFELEDLEETDAKIYNLISQEYNTIILTNEVAGFSGDIIKKYSKNDNVNIIITPSKRKKNT